MSSAADKAGGRAARGLALFLVVAACFVSGCRQTPPVVKIGLVAPFEGRYRAVGYDAIYAARLGIREVNAGGGIGAYRVALVALDDSGEPDLAQQAAASLVVDSAVVAVIGHWRAETTEAALPLYRQANLPLVATGQAPFVAVAPATLPDAFRDAYAEVTPFDEKAGAYAGATYDALYLVLNALEVAEMEGEVSRRGVEAALDGLQYEGMTGRVFWRQQ